MFQEPCRTDNDVEGWHRRINTKAGRTTLQFYLLVPLLHQEADHVDLTAKLLSSDKIKKYFKKTSTRIQAQLTDLWSSYNTTDMSASSFLRKAGRIYRPHLQEDNQV